MGWAGFGSRMEKVGIGLDWIELDGIGFDI